MDNTKMQEAKNAQPIYGYAGKILRVDLTNNKVNIQLLEEQFCRKYIGGAVMGIKYIFDELSPSIKWSDPENILFLGSGPLGCTRVSGSGGTAVVSKGPLTNGIGSTQANGIFGAYLRLTGYDAVVLEGAASDWIYIHIQKDKVEFKDARHLIGKTTWQMEDIIRQELGKGLMDVSVLSIGPAGDHLVKFACIFTDYGHIAAHNGVGAVMGSKKVKAIVVERGKTAIPLKYPELVSQLAKQMQERARVKFPNIHVEGVGSLIGNIMAAKLGELPVKNYTQNSYPFTPEILDSYHPANIKTKFGENKKIIPCWACSAKHCIRMEIPEGKFKGHVFEEPDGEAVGLFHTNVGIQDVTMTLIIADEVDRLGLDVNESGFIMSWVIECYEKGILTQRDTDGLEMKWGNAEAIMAMLKKIAYREGFGNVLAEGVMRAAQQVGGEAPRLAIHTKKGNIPRGHDHRSAWFELFDTCVSNLGTIESHRMAPFEILGLSRTYDGFDPIIVSTMVAKTKGATLFEDSLMTCRFNTATQLDLLSQIVNAATGWNLDIDEAMIVGKRGVNLARVFNLYHGIRSELDIPSERYGSTLTDGIHAGKGIMPFWNSMLQNYYNLMGWDETGKPLPKTLQILGLEDSIPILHSIN